MFSLISPGGTNLVWRVGAADLVTSIVPVSTSNVLPVITATYYDDMLGTNGVILNAGEGSLVVFVRDASGPLAGAAVSVTPTPTYLPMHETATKAVWVTGDTGASGASWTPGVSALQPTASVLVTPPAGAGQSFTLPIQDGTITFATLVF